MIFQENHNPKSFLLGSPSLAPNSSMHFPAAALPNFPHSYRDLEVNQSTKKTRRRKHPVFYSI